MKWKYLLWGILILTGIIATIHGWMTYSSRAHNAVVEMPASGSVRPDLAVILSGDGGWADLDRDLGKILVNNGIPVLGLDCLNYFWVTRTPDEMATDFSRIIRDTMTKWHKDRLLLIGYSFGASAMPFLVNRLPDDLRQKVDLVVMLSPGTSTNWEIWVDDWITDAVHDSATPTLPEALKMQGTRILCIYGQDDDSESLCRVLSPQEQLEILVKPGGHHYDEDYTRLAQDILSRLH